MSLPFPAPEEIEELPRTLEATNTGDADVSEVEGRSTDPDAAASSLEIK